MSVVEKNLGSSSGGLGVNHQVSVARKIKKVKKTQWETNPHHRVGDGGERDKKWVSQTPKKTPVNGPGPSDLGRPRATGDGTYTGSKSGGGKNDTGKMMDRKQKRFLQVSGCKHGKTMGKKNSKIPWKG